MEKEFGDRQERNVVVKRMLVGVSTVIAVCLMVVLVVSCSSSEEEAATSTTAMPVSTTGEGSPTTTETPSSTSGPSGAEGSETIVLKYGTGFMEGQAHSVPQGMFLDLIEERTNGRVEFERFWGGTLVSMTESSSEITSGVIDIGMTSAPYSPDGYMLGNATQGFFVRASDSETLALMHEEFRAMFPEIEEEVNQNKQFSFNAGTPPDQLMMAGKTVVAKVENMAGLQLRVQPRFKDLMVEVGVTPVSMGAGDMYMAIEKGTIDGAVGALDQLKSMRLCEIVKSVSLIDLYSAPQPIMEMNWDVWNSLPADIQQIFDESAESLDEMYREFFGQEVEESYVLAEEYGVAVVELEEADLELLYQANDRVCEIKAKQLDEQGYRGTEMLEEARRLIEKYEAM